MSFRHPDATALCPGNRCEQFKIGTIYFSGFGIIEIFVHFGRQLFFFPRCKRRYFIFISHALEKYKITQCLNRINNMYTSVTIRHRLAVARHVYKRWKPNNAPAKFSTNFIIYCIIVLYIVISKFTTDKLLISCIDLKLKIMPSTILSVLISVITLTGFI